MNSAVITGRLTADPELKESKSGKPWCPITIAVDRGSSDRETGEKHTDFFSMVLHEGAAKLVCDYCVKGDWISAQGAVYMRGYTRNNGDQGYSLELQYPRVTLCWRKREGDAAPRRASVVDKVMSRDEVDDLFADE